MDIQSLIDQADEKFEQNDFMGAIADYREAAVLGEPSSHVLINLTIVENLERLMFRKRLASLFPSSVLVKLHVAGKFEDGHFSQQALNVYSEILRFDNLSLRDETGTRFSRFSQACRTRSYEWVLEDFAVIWEKTEGDLKPMRRALLRIISEDIKHVKTAQILLEFVLSKNFPSWLTTLIEKKIEHMKALEEASVMIG